MNGSIVAQGNSLYFFNLLYEILNFFGKTYLDAEKTAVVGIVIKYIFISIKHHRMLSHSYKCILKGLTL